MKRHLLTTLALGFAAILAIVSATGCERSVPEPPTPTPEIIMSPQAPLPTLDQAAPTVISVLDDVAPGTPTPTIRWDLPTFTPTSEPVAAATPTNPPSPTNTTVPNPSPVPTESQPTAISYTVEWGDTLYGLAARYNTTVDAIVAASNLPNRHLISVGQVLTIPQGQQGPANGPASSQTYIVEAGDTLYKIASMYNTTAAAIAQANGIMNPAFINVGQQLVIPGATSGESSGSSVHIVQPGDTLTALAARFGTSVWAIAVANNLPNSNFVRAGQTLIIPAP